MDSTIRKILVGSNIAITQFDELDVILLKLAFGANPNNGLSNLVWYILHEKIEIIKLLLLYGLDVNSRDTKGMTLLMYTSLLNRIAAVKLLLERRADPNIKNNSGHTALMYASGYDDIITLLKKYGAVQ